MRTILTAGIWLVLPVLVLAADEEPPKDAAPPERNQLKPTNEIESWVFELTDEGDGEVAVDGDAIVFKTTKTTGTDWHVQAYQTGLDLREGKDYVVRFKMKSPQEVTLLLVGQIHEPDWHEIGLHQDIQPTKEFEDYEFEFTATDTVQGNNRIGFVLGIDEGEVHVKDMTLTRKE